MMNVPGVIDLKFRFSLGVASADVGQLRQLFMRRYFFSIYRVNYSSIFVSLNNTDFVNDTTLAMLLFSFLFMVWTWYVVGKEEIIRCGLGSTNASCLSHITPPGPVRAVPGLFPGCFEQKSYVQSRGPHLPRAAPYEFASPYGACRVSMHAL